MLPAPGVAINPEVAVPLLDYHTAARLVVRRRPRRPAAGGTARLLVPVQLGAPLPAWYRAGARAAGAAQVLISGDPAAPPPDALSGSRRRTRPRRVFGRDAVFRYRTYVASGSPRNVRRQLAPTSLAGECPYAVLETAEKLV